MCWCNFFLQKSNYKSHVYKDGWHLVCHKNISIAISLIFPRNPFISHPRAGFFVSRNETTLSPWKHAQIYLTQTGKLGQEERTSSTTIPKVWCLWHINIKLLTPDIQRMSILDFPGGPVVKTPRFHCRGRGSIPGRGRSRMPQGAAKKKKEEKKVYS